MANDAWVSTNYYKVGNSVVVANNTYNALVNNINVNPVGHPTIWKQISTTVDPTVVTTISQATPNTLAPAINVSSTTIATFVNLNEPISSMTANLTGTPVDGQTLTVRLSDNGTARTINWGSAFESSTVMLPTTTVANVLLTVVLQYNKLTSKWRCILVA